MASDVEPSWDKPSKVAHTRFRLEHTLTLPALEIVMMALARDLEPPRLAGQFDGHDHGLFGKGFDGPVDRRHS